MKHNVKISRNTSASHPTLPYIVDVSPRYTKPSGEPWVPPIDGDNRVAFEAWRDAGCEGVLELNVEVDG